MDDFKFISKLQMISFGIVSLYARGGGGGGGGGVRAAQ